MSQQATISNLCDEECVIIFSYLNAKLLFLNVALTCKRFKNLLYTIILNSNNDDDNRRLAISEGAQKAIPNAMLLNEHKQFVREWNRVYMVKNKIVETLLKKKEPMEFAESAAFYLANLGAWAAQVNAISPEVAAQNPYIKPFLLGSKMKILEGVKEQGVVLESSIQAAFLVHLDKFWMKGEDVLKRTQIPEIVQQELDGTFSL